MKHEAEQTASLRPRRVDRQWVLWLAIVGTAVGCLVVVLFPPWVQAEGQASACCMSQPLWRGPATQAIGVQAAEQSSLARIDRQALFRQLAGTLLAGGALILLALRARGSASRDAATPAS